MLATITVLMAGLAQAQTWDLPDQPRRRALIITSVEDTEVDPGFQCCGRVRRREASAEDLAGAQVVYEGRPIATAIRPSPQGEVTEIWFRIQRQIPKDRTDDRYCLYYGRPSKAPAPGRFRDVFDFFEDFDEGGASPQLIIDPRLKMIPEAGGLRLPGIPAECTTDRPGWITLTTPTPARGFALEADIRFDAHRDAAFSMTVVLELDDPGKSATKDRLRAVRLADLLEDPAIEVREQAVRDLIDLGRAALPALDQVTQTGDDESRSRAREARLGILERHPDPVIRAGLQKQGDRNEVMETFQIGPARGAHAGSGKLSGKVRLVVEQHPDLDVQVSWDEQRLDHGRTPGRVASVRFEIVSGTSGETGPISIESLGIRSSGQGFGESTGIGCILGSEGTRP